MSTSETISELSEKEMQAVTPDKDTSILIKQVMEAAEEIKPLHKKLNDVIDRHRTAIILLKTKFGIKQGSRGVPMLVGGKHAMYWDDFVDYYFGCTTRRLNQLLDMRDDKDPRILPAEKKASQERLIKELNEQLEILKATPKARDLAKQVASLKHEMNGMEYAHEKQLGALQGKYDHLLLNPTSSISEAEKEKPTILQWRDRLVPKPECKLKYFSEAGDSFADRYRYSFEGTALGKVFSAVGNPKYADDLNKFADLLDWAAEDLRILARAVRP